MLFNAARSAIRHNPVMREFYQRLVTENRRPGKVALTANRFDAQRLQEQVGRLVEQPDQPAEQAQVEGGREGQPPGDRFGSRDGQVFREELTEQHLHERREQHGQDGADGDPDRGRDTDTTE